jgi:hypothetical protein
MWTVWIRFNAVWVCGCREPGSPHDLGQCSHLLMGSLWNSNIGDAGARDLGAALQVNTTLMTLQ